MSTTTQGLSGFGKAQPAPNPGQLEAGTVNGQNLSLNNLSSPSSTPPGLDGSDGPDDRLIPRPSTSPDDPLNWSWLKKHAVMLALIPGCLLTDWTLTWGTTVFELQAPEW